MKKKNQYLWVDQEFYNHIMNKADELKRKGMQTGAADLTRRLAPIIKENIKFDAMFDVRWKKRRKR